MISRRLPVTFSLLLLLTVPHPLFAAGRLVKQTQIRSIIFQTVVREKPKSYRVTCFKNSPGTISKKSKKIFFTSLSQEEKALKAGKKTGKVLARLKTIKAMKKAAASACKSSATPPVTTPPAPPPAQPDHLSLQAYTGSFGYEEAQMLYNRFGFGGTPSEIQEATQLGLDGTVNRLLQYVEEPQLDAAVNDIECDGWKADDPDAGTNNRQCDPANVNDFDREGLRSGIIYRYIYSKNQFFHRLGFFLMDERMAVADKAARDCEKHTIRTYLASINRAAQTGDYIRYLGDMNKDQLLHLRWLDGATNRGGASLAPNENYAREFWELGSLGPTDLDGRPVYSDLDIAQSALAFTGWKITQSNVNGTSLCQAVYDPTRHTDGPKTVFIGTPYQAVVSNSDDILTATKNHPRLAEHLAEDIWKEFINPFAAAPEIKGLAQLIRNNNYNLLPVFREIMKSKAVMAPQSRRSLINHPIDMVVGFVRTTGFPLSYRRYNTIFQKLEQQVLNPPTVFGWDVKYLSGEQLQNAWWNTLTTEFININVATVKTRSNWTYYDRFVADLYAAGVTSSAPVIDRVSRDFGVPLTPAQKAEVDQVMNFTATSNGCPDQCSGMKFRLIRNQYDTHPLGVEAGTTGAGQRRIRMAIASLLQQPEARLK